MGAEYDERIFDAKDLSAARKEVEHIIEQCKYDWGHAGYTGTFAECMSAAYHPVVFQSAENARSYIDKTAVKWEEAILTRFREPEAPGKLRWIVGGVFSS